jgi:multicomponent Na+:H+ antiporter subunit A
VLVLLALHFALAMLAPVLVQWWGRRAFYALAMVPAAGFGWTAAQSATVRSGGAVVESYPWVPRLGLDVALRLNSLSWALALLVTGVGALVLVYCARYFEDGEPGLGRFAGVFVGFAGAMLGVVLSDGLILLYVFWELTTVFSYLLIGQDPERRASRRAASQALIVTTLGGLAMLVGFIMLGRRSGTYLLSEILASPPPASGYLATALVLILVGALAKSAIFPFSFWLPAAMAAPTPVSAYLHAAAMVKAGVYLIGALAPVFAAVAPWRPIVLIGGVATMVLGGWAALRQTDLKLLLAYGTVSQLGLLTAVLGAGTRDAALAGLAMLLAHGLFKAALFLIVGIVDHQAGTRDIRELSGQWRRQPWAFSAACLASASMAGIPPLLGFVAKESVFEAFLTGTESDLAVLAGLVAGSALTAAYTARFLWGGFATKPGRAPTPAAAPGWVFLAAPGMLAAAGLALAPLAGWLDPLLTPYADLAGGGDYHLALWHGLTPALGLSALALAAGLALFVGRRTVARVVAALRLPHDGGWVYGMCVRALDRLAVEVTGATQRGSLPFYLGTVLVLVVLFPGGALLLHRGWASEVAPWQNPVEPVVGAGLVAVALLAVRSRRRLTAMLFVGLTGYGTALLFVLRGAPDLALTQFLVETVSIVAFVLVLRRLPTHFSDRPWRHSRWIRRAIGASVGLVVALLSVAAVGGQRAEPISVDFPQAALEADGRNVVNVTLVDIRAWDTMGEISVLVVMATGVASLILVRPRARRVPGRRQARRAGVRRPTAGRRGWLVGGRAELPEQQSIIFEVITRLIFHVIVLYSVYLVFSGHSAPGGGFAGGLVAGMALTIRYLAGGQREIDEAAPVDAGLVLGAGLLLAIGTGVIAMFLGGEFLQSAAIDVWLPLIGEVHVVTSLFFDIGVYLVVIGLILDILRSLGGEVDRQLREEQAGQAHRQKELV